MARVEGLGTFDSARLRAGVGRRVEVGGRAFLVLAPSGRDLQDTLDRGPQVIAAKDVAALLYEADVVPGSTVVEAGSGSGALTIALARAVRPTGRVVSYEVREDFLRLA